MSRCGPGRQWAWTTSWARALAGALVVVGTVGAGALGLTGTVAGASSPSCPSAACPYTAPSATEAGFAVDVLARMNVERAQPERDYPYDGETATLPPLPSDVELTETAQAYAEHLASTQVLMGYSGAGPTGEVLTAGNEAGPGYDSAGTDQTFMASYGHAVGYLSAAADLVGIGVAFDSDGRSWVVELFGDADQAAWQAGQDRLAAELAANSVYAQSGGTVTTVTEPASAGGGTDSAQQVFPTEPIAAASQFATGVDWTSTGPHYPAGSAPSSPLPGPVTAIAATTTGDGYLLADAAGAISVHGDASFFGSATGLALASPVIGLRTTPAGGGYWELGADGGVFTYGDASFYGSTGGLALNRPVVAMAPSASGGGYWLAASDGGVFAFGDAGFVGSVPGLGLVVSDIVGMVPTADGRGYWMVGADGGVFAFGDAGYLGSLPQMGVSVHDIVGMVPTADGRGYWLVGADGGVFAFGDAGYVGSLPGIGVSVDNVVGIAAPPTDAGYWLVGSDGAVYALGVPFYGED